MMLMDCEDLEDTLRKAARVLKPYVKAFIKVGLTVIDLNDPRASDEQAKRSVAMAWLQKIENTIEI